jgi:hypothetical protein
MTFPDLIPAANERQSLIGNSHSDWYSKWGHFTLTSTCGTVALLPVKRSRRKDIQSFTNHARANSRLLKAGNSRRENFSTNSEGIFPAATEADFLT